MPLLRANTFALTALLAALTGIGPLSTDMYLPSLPDISNRLDATTAQTQLTISAYLVGFGGEVIGTETGLVHWQPAEAVRAEAIDTPVVGWRGKWVNTLRLWNAQALDTFNTLATGAQKAEAQGVAWKQTNILVRDSFAQLGLSGQKGLDQLAIALDGTHRSAAEVNTALSGITSVINTTALVHETFVSLAATPPTAKTTTCS